MEHTFCPYLMLNEKKCRAVVSVGPVSTFKTREHMDLTEADIEKCKTIWDGCPIWRDEREREARRRQRNGD